MGKGINYKKPLYEVLKIENLKEMIEKSCSLHSERPAFLVKNKSNDAYEPITYNQFKKDIDAFGTGLIDLGLKDKRIAIIGENRYQWALSYLGIVNGTGVVVPIDKELPENEIENLLIRSESTGVIFTGRFVNIIKEIAERNKDLKYLINMDAKENQDDVLSYGKLLEKGRTLLDNGDTRFANAKIDNEAMSILLFTSGTTAESKAVMLSHKNIAANLMDMHAMVYMGPEDTFLSVLPIHHTYECSCGLLFAVSRGSATAYCEGLRYIAKNLKEAKATMMISVPLILESMYKRIWEQASKEKGTYLKLRIALRVSNLLRKAGIDLRKILFKKLHENFGGKLRLFVSGAAGINPRVAKGFRDLGMNFIQGYGLTECSPLAAVNRDIWFKDDAAGLPVPSVEIRIDQPMSDGSGEILVKGPNVMLGYYKNEKATQEVLKDGWFYSGDLGYIDNEGFVHITGRKKDVIVTKNGKNIYPEEMEKVLSESVYIKESMIWGKLTDDGDTVICAIIIPDNDKILEEFKSQLTEEQINELIGKEVKKVNHNMPLYRHIRDFVVRDEELAKTTTKKVKRHIELKRLNNDNQK